MDKLNSQQRKVFDQIVQGRNVFITGAGGVGKSFLIRYIKETMEERGIKVAVTALTGIAGLNLGGETIHRWAGIQTGEKPKDELVLMARKKSKNWNQTNILVVDEVSMLSPVLFDKLDYVGRMMRRINRPFGGIQLIFSGDFCQLPPVSSDKYCFECHTWQECNFLQCELTMNMRQSDPVFQKLLTEVRMGILTKSTKDILTQKLHAKLENENGIKPTKLFPTRKQVDRVNEEELAKIPRENNKPFKYVALHFILNSNKVSYNKDYEKDWIGSIDKVCPARKEIVLLKTTQVMLIHNLDPDAGLVNGSRGVIEDFEDGRPIVRFLNGIVRLILPHDWKMPINENIKVGRRQIPLILAYAATIHKSQSLTIDYVDADLGPDNFADGQLYTALSRVRSLEGLTLSGLDFSKCACHPKVIEFYKTLTRFELGDDDRPKVLIEDSTEIVIDDTS